ncbi:hypothetical protein NKH77_39395 [Streptomyces sp. M19]
MTFSRSFRIGMYAVAGMFVLVTLLMLSLPKFAKPQEPGAGCDSPSPPVGPRRRSAAPRRCRPAAGRAMSAPRWGSPAVAAAHAPPSGTSRRRSS